ncbi:MAG: type II toxin-antitoxin system RelE/ParE family toxin [Betaproteobacteria bacterium]|nr:type II toxin-antitoxin system RelE/ParE family toxin [Betaproteobacteria bacterium]
MKPCWTIRLSAAAERDYREILRWTAETFGRRQANTYARTLSNALRDLALGPSIRGARPREDVGAGIHTLHVAREGRKGRHLVVFRANASSGEQVIDVLRLLHDCMDLPRHLPAANGSDPPGSSQR